MKIKVFSIDDDLILRKNILKGARIGVKRIGNDVSIIYFLRNGSDLAIIWNQFSSFRDEKDEKREPPRESTDNPTPTLTPIPTHLSILCEKVRKTKTT
jgi:hypothetical protein